MVRKTPKKLLKKFQNEVNNTIYDFSDCSICGICCKDETLTMKEPDINRISRKLAIDKKSFLNQYTHYNIETEETVMNMPCPLLKDNRCTIYDIRPEICRNFPVFILEEGIVIINNIEECAKATHFFESFLDFCSKRYQDHYKNLIKNNHFPKSDSSVKNAVLPIKLIAAFIIWLNKD